MRQKSKCKVWLVLLLAGLMFSMGTNALAANITDQGVDANLAGQLNEILAAPGTNPFVDSLLGSSGTGTTTKATAEIIDAAAKGGAPAAAAAITTVGGASNAVVGARTGAGGGASAGASIAYNIEDGSLAASAGSIDGLAAGGGMKKGIGLWVMPMYQHHSGDGFKSGNFEYGYDTSFGGVSLGADYTFMNDVRVGLAFHVGAGTSDTEGGAAKSDNDFDYYGLSLYSAYHFGDRGQWALSGDIGYTLTDNEMKMNAAGGQLRADSDAGLFTIGVLGEYKYAAEMLDIIPYIGIRFNYLTIDSYDTNFHGVTGKSAFSKTDDIDATTVQFPVGVSFAKDFDTAAGWAITPNLDLGALFTVGDVDMEQDVRLTGASAFDRMNSEVADEVTFQGGLGIGLAKDGFSLDLEYKLNLSEHITGHGIFGTFRYEF